MRQLALVLSIFSMFSWADSITMPLKRIEQSSESLSNYGFCIEIKATVQERSDEKNLPFYLIALSYPASIGDANFESSSIFYGNEFDYLYNVEHKSKPKDSRASFRFALVPESLEKANVELTYWGKNDTAIYIFQLSDFLNSNMVEDYPSTDSVNKNCMKKYGQ